MLGRLKMTVRWIGDSEGGGMGIVRREDAYEDVLLNFIKTRS